MNVTRETLVALTNNAFDTVNALEEIIRTFNDMGIPTDIQWKLVYRTRASIYAAQQTLDETPPWRD